MKNQQLINPRLNGALLLYRANSHKKLYIRCGWCLNVFLLLSQFSKTGRFYLNKKWISVISTAANVSLQHKNGLHLLYRFLSLVILSKVTAELTGPLQYFLLNKTFELCYQDQHCLCVLMCFSFTPES